MAGQESLATVSPKEHRSLTGDVETSTGRFQKGDFDTGEGQDRFFFLSLPPEDATPRPRRGSD